MFLYYITKAAQSKYLIIKQTVELAAFVEHERFNIHVELRRLNQRNHFYRSKVQIQVDSNPYTISEQLHKTTFRL